MVASHTLSASETSHHFEETTTSKDGRTGGNESQQFGTQSPSILHLDQSRATGQDVQQSFHPDDNTTTTLHPSPGCIAPLSSSQSVNASMNGCLGHQSLATDLLATLSSADGEITNIRLQDQQSSVRGHGTAPTGANLEGVDTSIIPQFPNSNPSNSESINVFNPLDYPNLLLGAQRLPESSFPDVFNPLDYPSLISDTQLPPDSQFPDIFNPLDYPSVPADARGCTNIYAETECVESRIPPIVLPAS